MNTRILGYASVCAIAVGFVSSAWGDPADGGATLGERLTVLGVKTELEDALKVLGADPNTPRDAASEIRSDSLGPEKQLARTVDGRWFTVDTEAKRLVRYMMTGLEDVPDELTDKDAIPKATAVDKARKLFDALKISVTIDDAKVRYDGQASGKLARSRWVVSGRRFMNGIRCWSNASVQISAYSGQIVDFIDTPPLVAPKSFDQRLTKDEAVALALDFVQSRGLRVKGVGTPELELQVAPPNNAWTRQEGERFAADWKQSYLCWIVSFESDSQFSEIGPIVFIDAQTGAIVGGCQ
jgi:hypothetical protein